MCEPRVVTWAPLVMRILGLICILILPLGACLSGKGSLPSQSPRSPTARDADSHALPPAPAASAKPAFVDAEVNVELIVGSMRGLEAWRRDGRGKRMISKSPALYPRWLDKTNVLVFRAKDETNWGAGGVFERISLVDGKRTRVAKFPEFSCELPAEVKEDTNPLPKGLLDLEDPEKFVIDESGERACVFLVDGDENSPEVNVSVEVDFKTGKVTLWLWVGQLASCLPPKGVKSGDAQKCKPRHEPRPKSHVLETGIRFDFESEEIVEVRDSGTPAPRVRLPGYKGEGYSPSNRWFLLGGDEPEEETTSNFVVLFDRTTGQVYPIRSGTWPAPLQARGKTPPLRIHTPVSKTREEAQYSDLRWLGLSEASEVLVIDDLVVWPGHRAFSVGGQVAR
jgi:hypothetical protein